MALMKKKAPAPAPTPVRAPTSAPVQTAVRPTNTPAPFPTTQMPAAPQQGLLDRVLQTRGTPNDPTAQFRASQQAQTMLRQLPPAAPAMPVAMPQAPMQVQGMVSPGAGVPNLANPAGPRPTMGQQYVQAVPPMQTYDPQAMAKRVLEMSVNRIPADLSYDSNGDGRITAADALAVSKGWQRPGDQMAPMNPMPGGMTMPSPGVGGMAGLLAAQQQQQMLPSQPMGPGGLAGMLGIPQNPGQANPYIANPRPMTPEQQLMIQNLSTPAFGDMRFTGGPTMSQQNQQAREMAMASAQQQAMGMGQPPMSRQDAINQVYDQARASGRNVFDYSSINKPASPPPVTGPFPPSMRPQQNSPVPMQQPMASQMSMGPQQPQTMGQQQRPMMGPQQPFGQQQSFGPQQQPSMGPQQRPMMGPQQQAMGPQQPNQAAGNQRAKLF